MVCLSEIHCHCLQCSFIHWLLQHQLVHQVNQLLHIYSVLRAELRPSRLYQSVNQLSTLSRSCTTFAPYEVYHYVGKIWGQVVYSIHETIICSLNISKYIYTHVRMLIILRWRSSDCGHPIIWSHTINDIILMHFNTHST